MPCGDPQTAVCADRAGTRIEYRASRNLRIFLSVSKIGSSVTAVFLWESYDGLQRERNETL